MRLRRRVGGWLALTAALGLVVVTLMQGALYRHAANLSADRQEALDADLTRLTGQVLADHRRWRDDPLFAARDGGDAAGLLATKIGWPGAPAPHTIPDELIERFREAGAAWVSKPGFDVEPFDLEWMQELSRYSVWDLESVPSPLAARALSLDEPEPRYVQARGLARVRLRQGLDRGELGPAAREVRELARLLLTTERLTGELFAISLLGLEREACEEAARRGQPVASWQPLSKADTESLRRALWSAQLWTSLYAAPPVEAAAEFPVVGRCGALAELATSLAFKPWAAWPFSARYTQFTERLAAAPCRLRRLRRAWADDREGQLARVRDICGIAGEACEYDEGWLNLPLGHAVVGHTLAASATPDWLRPYKEAEPSSAP